MALILSKALKQQRPQKILVCGDSFFGDDFMFPKLHWTHRLPNHIEITNAARAGSSNAMILDQFLQNFDFHDAVIFGFTGSYRIEFDRENIDDQGNLYNRWLTDCNVPRLTNEEIALCESYMKLTSFAADTIKQCAIMAATLEIAKPLTRVCYSLSLGRELVRDMVVQYPNQLYFKRMMSDDLPFNLPDYHRKKEKDGSISISIEDNIWPSFHVRSPDAHQRFADQILSWVEGTK